MAPVASIWKRSEMTLVSWNGSLKRVSLTAAPSLPFDRRRRLARDVVDDAIDAADLVDDACRDPLEHVVRQPRPVGGHPVFARDGADRHHVRVRSEVAHDADALQRGQDGEVLPRLRTGAALDLVARDRVTAPQDREPLICHRPEHADGETGTGERLTRDDRFRQTEFST